MKETAKKNIKLKEKFKRQNMRTGLAFDNFGYVSNNDIKLNDLNNHELKKQISTISSFSLLSNEDESELNISNNFFNELYLNMDCLKIEINECELEKNENDNITLNRNDSIYENLSVDSDNETNLNV
jgi:hypothetical protein